MAARTKVRSHRSLQTHLSRHRTASTTDSDSRCSYPPLGVTAGNPDSSVNWAQFLPISGLPAYNRAGVSPYAEQYNLTIDRQLGSNTLLSMSYVGSQAHHLLVLLEANPSNPAACLSVSQTSQVAPGTPTCGPFSETGSFTTAAGQSVVVRQPFGANFGSVDWLSTIGNSNFNAFELTLRHTGRVRTVPRGLHLRALVRSVVEPFGATQSRSTIERPTLRPHSTSGKTSSSATNRNCRSIGCCRRDNRFTEGWSISGITRFSTGFPVTFYNDNDTSLYGTQPDGVNPYGVDLPELHAGPAESK